MPRYRFTSRRRTALRKAQLASARKRRRGGRARKAALIAGGAVALGAGAYVAQDRVRYTRLYHQTSHRNAHLIVKKGFNPGSKDVAGNVFFSKRKPTKVQRRNYGAATIRVKGKRSHFKGNVYRDLNHRTKFYYEVHHTIVNNPSAGVKIQNITNRRRARRQIRRRR